LISLGWEKRAIRQEKIFWTVYVETLGPDIGTLPLGSREAGVKGHWYLVRDTFLSSRVTRV
jgi:hypothetical protein